MQVILVEDVENLGSVGTMHTVRPGYGRNFLLPRGLAVLASKRNVKQLEHQQRVANFRLAKAKASADLAVKQLQGITLVLKRKVGEQAKLFGSVTSHDISEALGEQGIKVEHRKISLAEPIKQIGTFDVAVRLHKDVAGTIKVSVEAE